MLFYRQDFISVEHRPGNEMPELAFCQCLGWTSKAEDGLLSPASIPHILRGPFGKSIPEEPFVRFYEPSYAGEGRYQHTRFGLLNRKLAIKIVLYFSILKPI
jgi:hypothetical protein